MFSVLTILDLAHYTEDNPPPETVQGYQYVLISKIEPTLPGSVFSSPI